LIEQREQERTQIARDLHDGPIQELTGAALTLQGIILDNRDLGVTRQLGELASSLQTQIGELRAYAQELRPPALAKFGLEQAIRSHMDLFEEKHPELSITFEGHQQGELTSVPLRMAYYRIYQEALNNILKHTHANQVTIRFEKDEHEVVLEIHDNGQGFKPPGDWLSLARGGHLGLVGMRERAEAVGGTLEVRSEPGQGTTVRVKVRLNPG
jgi:signal transduction histidine kinase